LFDTSPCQFRKVGMICRAQRPFWFGKRADMSSCQFRKEGMICRAQRPLWFGRQADCLICRLVTWPVPRDLRHACPVAWPRSPRMDQGRSPFPAGSATATRWERPVPREFERPARPVAWPRSPRRRPGRPLFPAGASRRGAALMH